MEGNKRENGEGVAERGRRGGLGGWGKREVAKTKS